jgi:hypothetical protein
MNALLKDLLRDEYGFLISAELVIVGTVLVLGLVTGMACLQKALVQEYKDLACAFGALDQSYSDTGMHGCFSSCGRTSWTAGSAYGERVEVMPTFGIYTPPAPVIPQVPVCPPVEVPQPTPPAIPCPQPYPAQTPCPCHTSPLPAPVLPPCAPAPSPCAPTVAPCDPRASAPGATGTPVLPHGVQLQHVPTLPGGPVVW